MKIGWKLRDFRINIFIERFVIITRINLHICENCRCDTYCLFIIRGTCEIRLIKKKNCELPKTKYSSKEKIISPFFVGTHVNKSLPRESKFSGDGGLLILGEGEAEVEDH